MTAVASAEAGELTAFQGLSLSVHPLQRTGARSVAVLAGRDSPADVSAADLDRVTAVVVRDVVKASVASKEQAAYDWWKVLFALYPNSKPTHAGRTRDQDALSAEVSGFFAADDLGLGPLRRCSFCDAPCNVLWSKSMLPMFDTTKFLNTLPPNVAGWPICRPCRLALWALPYGAAVTAGSATVLTCDDDAVEQAFVTVNCRRTAMIRQVGFSGLRADASPEAVTLWALRTHARARTAATLWSFKNDNQNPWLRVAGTRLAVVGFLRAVPADSQARDGWKALERASTRRAKDGSVERRGSDVVARALFEQSRDQTQVGHVGDRLLSLLFSRADAVEKVPGRTLSRWRALSALYLKEMYDMDTTVLKPATVLIADWIQAEKNPRGRFNEYRNVAGKAFGLQGLLMKASCRLYLDGQLPEPVNEVTVPLLASNQDGWRLRGQLFFEVVAELVNRGVQVGTKSGDEDDHDETDVTVAMDSPDDEEAGA